jgi:hypothetical protein
MEETIIRIYKSKKEGIVYQSYINNQSKYDLHEIEDCLIELLHFVNKTKRRQ